MKALILLWTVAANLPALAQISKVIVLDSVMISASNSTFDTDAFIERVKNDTTFYKAFKNLRYYPHRVSGKAGVLRPSGMERATMQKVSQQFVNQQKMWMVEQSSSSTGKVIDRKGNHRYFTLQMFDEVFFPTDTVAVSSLIGNYSFEDEDDTRTEGHKNSLKVMMFNPGREVSGVPIVGKKMGIFEADMIPYYDYKLWEYNWQGEVPCVVFSCTAKSEFSKNKTVIKDLTSYFEKETMQVIAREYRVAYRSLLFDFDVRIVVENAVLDQVLVPMLIKYSGFWDIPLQKEERINFEVENTGYQIGE